MVKYIDKKNTYVDENSKFGRGCIIYPFSVIEGNCVFGDNVIIGPNSYIKDCLIGNNCSIYAAYIFDSEIGDNCNIGPFSFIRDNVTIDNNVKIGTFVEVKKTDIGVNSKIPHLSYIGDSSIGCDVNIGGGAITANYDGKKKHKTVFEDGCFIGVNSSLIAPLNIGKNSVVGAGSTITRNLPDYSLGIGRLRQENKVNYYKK